MRPSAIFLAANRLDDATASAALAPFCEPALPPRASGAHRSEASRSRAFQSNHARIALVCLAVALAGAAPVQASWTDRPPGKNCVWEGEHAPRNLRPAFYKRAVTLVASVNGLHGQELRMSIEAVCDVPEKLATGAASLAGADGVALRLRRTTVWEDRALKIGPPATVLLDGADTVLVRGRVTRPGSWHEERDGSRIPTFRAGRIVVTD